ncbi:hypothetical protein [Bosea massiliensis]|uniref:Uncharacterized protein n=1 Tax=Bosea massiliensis TaxID=151419 RepID=A0ABW0P555_9HYPH
MPILRWLSRRRAYNQLVEQEAQALVARNGGDGYYTARQIAQLAKGQADLQSAKLWWRVSRRVAAMTGIEPGKAKVGLPESEW